ncbi:MAG: hypothetical protein WC371_03740, partial [Parachlamydiales bacterium]
MLWDQEKKTPSYWRIGFWVAAFHLFFVGLLQMKDVAVFAPLKPKLQVQNFYEPHLVLETKAEAELQTKEAGAAVETAAENNLPKPDFSAPLEAPFSETGEALTVEAKPFPLDQNSGPWPEIPREGSDFEKKREEKKTAAALAEKAREKKSPKKVLEKKDGEKKASPSSKPSPTPVKRPVKKAVRWSPEYQQSLKKRIRAEERKKQQRLEKLKNLEESLAQLGSSARSSEAMDWKQAEKPELQVPRLDSGSWKAAFSFEEGNFSDLRLSQAEEEQFEKLFLSYLKESLHLPEIGEVKLKLTLDAEGQVKKTEVLWAESPKNRRYLEEAL